MVLFIVLVHYLNNSYFYLMGLSYSLVIHAHFSNLVGGMVSLFRVFCVLCGLISVLTYKNTEHLLTLFHFTHFLGFYSQSNNARPSCRRRRGTAPCPSHSQRVSQAVVAVYCLRTDSYSPY